jgi:hypothetical protein
VEYIEKGILLLDMIVGRQQSQQLGAKMFELMDEVLLEMEIQLKRISANMENMKTNNIVERILENAV